MSNFYIYKFDYLEAGKKVSATVIFCDREDINQAILASEIRTFYERNYQTDSFFVLGRDSMTAKLKEVAFDNFDETFKYIPRRSDTHLKENLYTLVFDINGELKRVNSESDSIPKGFLDKFLNEGLQNIFISRGGLIHSPHDSHHFVFPSGKHSDKFLRTGNILLVSSEIYFIAFSLLKSFNHKKYSQIYCDSSSINSLAFALIELKNRFLSEVDKIYVPVESFSSYEGLYKNDLNYKKDALLLISASTSAKIIKRIREKHSEVALENILILYYLGEKSIYQSLENNIICNLTHSDDNPNGIEGYVPYDSAQECKLCQKGSFAVEVKGDVFSIEKPKINRVLLTINDPEKNLSTFVNQFKSVNKKNTVLKTHYKENQSFRKYEIYIDYSELIQGLNTGSYQSYKSKLDNYINQYVPSNLKYLVHLEDNSSKELSDYILKKVKSNYQKRKLPKQISQDELITISNKEVGAILVIASCVSNGKNLLFISRALRKYDKLRVVYFVGVVRTKNREYLDSLKKNLKQGVYGPENSSFVEVESIFCENNSKDTSWIQEIDFLKKFNSFLKDNGYSDLVIEFFTKRKTLLESAGGDEQRGLSENLFFPRIFSDTTQEELSIRKNFAFFNFSNYEKNVTQSDIYFTISNILNSIRNGNKENKSLKQTAYVRNLLDPVNFNRFNDGIIQASILRAAYPEELSYALDSELSVEMTGIIENTIKYHADERGEALLEFLYAIATSKLTLRKGDLEKVTNLIGEKCNDDIFKAFKEYIVAELIKKK